MGTRSHNPTGRYDLLVVSNALRAACLPLVLSVCCLLFSQRNLRELEICSLHDSLLFSPGFSLVLMLILSCSLQDARAATCAGIAAAHRLKLQELHPEAGRLIEWMLTPLQANRASVLQASTHNFLMGVAEPESPQADTAPSDAQVNIHTHALSL